MSIINNEYNYIKNNSNINNNSNSLSDEWVEMYSNKFKCIKTLNHRYNLKKYGEDYLDYLRTVVYNKKIIILPFFYG